MNLLITKSTILALILYLFLSSVAHAKLNFYFYYPDSPTSNMSQLKNEMDLLFQSENIDVNFQPFAREFDFKQQVSKNGDAVLMTPSWVLPAKGDVQIMLKAFANGQSQYGKVLITKATSNLTIKALKGMTLAMTAMGNMPQVNHTLLNEIKSDGIHIVEVSKDIDAIFAVALKQVDGALVTLSSLERIKKLNPRIILSIKIIADAEFISLPSLYSFHGATKNREIVKLLNFMKGLKNLKQNPFLKLLEIDEWREAK